jgi:A/G-specific adenine glycosylase
VPSSFTGELPEQGDEFRRRLLAWHPTRSRVFPWRDTRDPFAVLVAEVMLQRTQAPQAARIFREFTCGFPTPSSVLAASGAVETLLAGLGLRHRARRMLELCRALVDRHSGGVPDDPVALLALPGVGAYTTGAVLSFGYGQDAAIVDRNVVRVLTRVFGLTPNSTRPHTDRKLWLLAASLVPAGRSRAYNLALLDFAATVCRVKPRHDQCPLTDICRYFARLDDVPPSTADAPGATAG